MLKKTLSYLRLPFTFEPKLLRGDLDNIAETEWIGHFNRRDYEGGWSGIALRGPADAIHPIQSLVNHPGAREFADTEVLHRCPQFRQVLSHFHCPLRSVRLLRLHPGAIVREHRDPELNLEDGETRIHVPVTTNPGVEFVVAGESIVMREGETWYINVSLPHRLANHGETHRIHIVIDCEVNEWLQSLFTGTAAE